MREHASVRVALGLLVALLLGGCSDLSSSPAAGTFTPRTRGVLTVVTTDIPSPGFWEGTPAHVTGGLEYELARDLADPGSEMIAAAMPKGSSNRQAVNSAMRAFADDGTMNHFVHVWVGSAADDAEKSLPLIQTNRVT